MAVVGSSLQAVLTGAALPLPDRRDPHRAFAAALLGASAKAAILARPSSAEAATAARSATGAASPAAVAAARLIAKGALDGEGDGAPVEALAARIGVGAPHLCRLFERHVGTSTAQVVRTVRVQRAKRLLDGTDLPMAEVALRSGFSSLRRSSAVFAEVYRRPPTAIRRRRPFR